MQEPVFEFVTVGRIKKHFFQVQARVADGKKKLKKRENKKACSPGHHVIV